MKTCVIIPMYGHHEMTKKCVELTLAKAGTHVEIVVVDDGSPQPFVYHNDNRVFVYRLDKNSGYTNATNQGILWCKDRYEYLFLQNNDIEPEEDYIKVLVDAMEEDKSIGIAGSCRRMNKDSVELYGADLIRGHQFMADNKTFSELPDLIPAKWIPACSILVRMEMLRYIGILDPRMRTWCSDTDICFRALLAGWKVVLATKSIVFHHHQVTTGKNNEEAVSKDQQVILEKIAGVPYAELMRDMPLDAQSNTYGQLRFETYKK